MTVFWGLAAVLVIGALLFMLPWLLREHRTVDTDVDGLNTEVIRTQLAELETDLETGRLDRSRYEAARHDLERELLYDLSRAPQEARPARSGRWLALVLVVLVPLAAFGLYNLLGTKQIIPLLARTSLPAADTQTTPGQPHSVEEMVNQLANRLRENPDNLEGWQMLARSYDVLRRYQDAVTAYENVLRLGDRTANTLADYVDVRAMANGGEFDERDGELLQTALDQQPDHVKALWLMGHWKNQHADYTGAIAAWERVAARLPPGSQDTEVINEQIALARQHAGLPPAQTAPPAAVATAADAGNTAATAASIQVSVALDPQLADRVEPGDTVFVFARAMSGPRMPLAIVRKTVRDLPFTVVLDDSLAMSPVMTLSKFDQVSIGARVSKTGNAMPQSGDLQGSVSPVATGVSVPVTVVINETVPPVTAATAAGAAGAAPSAASIRVSVTLDPQLADRAKPDDTVFIFARAVNGPRMPLAIVRKQVRDLPVSVVLDDSLAMSPAMTLSKFDQVSIGARISKSGNAMPQSGDLQGSVSPVVTGTPGPVSVVIGETVP